MKTIIAATDFSENATRAVQQAAWLARAWDAKLILAHVFNDGVWASIKAVYDVAGWSTDRPADAAHARLLALGAQVAKEFGVHVDTVMLNGRASQQISGLVAARQAEMLVVGEHGENWVSDVVLGGTALKVIEATRVPVLLVRRKTPGGYRDIVIASDFSPAAGRAACLALACFPDARHALVHAWLVPLESSMRMGGAREKDIQRYRDREFAIASTGLENFARDCESRAGGRLERLALHGSPAAVILEQVRAGNGDLIAIGKHGGEYSEELLLGSVTQNILYHADCDVLLSA